jgi:hypothetical protein
VCKVNIMAYIWKSSNSKFRYHIQMSWHIFKSLRNNFLSGELSAYKQCLPWCGLSWEGILRYISLINHITLKFWKFLLIYFSDLGQNWLFLNGTPDSAFRFILFQYYYFVRLMGGKASHVAFECALQSHPNMVRFDQMKLLHIMLVPSLYLCSLSAFRSS